MKNLFILVAALLTASTQQQSLFSLFKNSMKTDAFVDQTQSIFSRCDKDLNQAITKEEYVKCTHNYEGWNALKRYDTNRDQKLQFAEVYKAVSDQDRKSNKPHFLSLMSDEDEEAIK